MRNGHEEKTIYLRDELHRLIFMRNELHELYELNAILCISCYKKSCF